MNKLAKRLTALALSAAMLTAPAGAITADGESETWFDGVRSLIDAFSIKTEHDPLCVLQNYINKYLEKHPEEMYDVLNDILGLLDTRCTCRARSIRRAFPRSKALSASASVFSRRRAACRSRRSSATRRPRRLTFRSATFIVKIDGEDVSGAESALTGKSCAARRARRSS